MKITKLVADAIANQVVSKMYQVHTQKLETVKQNIASSEEYKTLLTLQAELKAIETKRKTLEASILNQTDDIYDAYIKPLKHTSYDKYNLRNFGHIKLSTYIDNEMHGQIKDHVIINSHFVESADSADTVIDNIVEKFL